MTADQLIDVLVARLIRDKGGTKHQWRKRVGPVQLYSLATHPHCNWAVNPVGTRTETEAIERLIDDLRISHPIIATER